MGPDLGWIKRAQAAGLSDEDIQAYLDAWARPVPPLSDAPSAGALRQRRYMERKNKASLSVTDDVTVTQKNVPPHPPKENTNLPVAPSRDAVAGSGPKKGSRMAEDWRPSERALAKVRAKGYPEPFIEREVERMRNHFAAKTGSGSTSANWDLNFYNWLSRAQEYQKSGPQKAENLVEKWKRKTGT